VSLTAAAADQAASAGGREPAGAVHQTTLERAFGRIFAVLAALIVLQFWFSSSTLSGQRPGSVAANLLLSLLLIRQAVRTLRRPPSQRDLCLLAAATGVLLLASRLLAVPGSPFLNDDAYVMAGPVAVAWAVWSGYFVVPVPVLVIVLGTGAWSLAGDLPAEQSVAALATVACTGFAARLMRTGARRADAEADVLSRRMAAQDAALAAEEAERRAANAVHDDVLSVLRAVSAADHQLPWSVVVSKARRAQDALAEQAPRGERGLADLESVLRRLAGEFAAELNVCCDIDSDLDVPSSAAEALSAATGEALRNVTAHAGVRSALVTARRNGPSEVKLTISDSGIGFDPARVGPASTGLRNSVRARLDDAGGSATIISSRGQGTAVVLTWAPPQAASAPAVDPLAWARRLAPRPQLIFAGFMLPLLVSALVMLCLRWQDLRWPPAGVAAFAGLLVLAAASTRNVSRVHLARPTAVGMAVAVTALTAAGSLAVAPGATDAFAYWVAGESAILIAVLYFLQGPAFGLTVLAIDLAALTAGLLVTGSAISPGGWVSILTSPVIGAGLAAGMLAAFRSLSDYTESQLTQYSEGLRRQARAEAISRVDSAALENARRVAGPVLSLVASGEAANDALRTAAALANATLRDELLAPGFLTAPLAARVRAARTSGARITVDIARHGDAALVGMARRLLAAALTDLDTAGDVTLQAHPPAEGHPALLILHARSRISDHAALRERARGCGALVTNLGDHELLVRFQPGPQHAAPLHRANCPGVKERLA
jgi:signal transduction histidine kinase